MITCLFISTTQADDFPDKPVTSTQKNFTIAIQPLQLFNWAWRLDFEARLGNSNGWLQFGPAIYSVDKSGGNENPSYYYYEDFYYYTNFWFDIGLREPFSKLNGYGLDINYKQFLNPSQFFYFAGGLSYTRINIKYFGRVFKDYIEDGLQYHESVSDFHTQTIKKFGVNAFLGIQIPNRSAFLCDMFWGLAYRHSFSDNKKYAFNNTMFSFGYSGVVLLMGVRLGVKFN